MNAIGGYLGLELRRGYEFHGNAIKLNTGRNAFKYILITRSYKKVYLPYYTCEVIFQPIQELGLEYEFYFIDNKFEPIFDFKKVEDKEVFLYTNYFGLKDDYLLKLKSLVNNLIIDNAQAFFATPLESIDTFYSARKFFGVSDGAYLYTNKTLNEQLSIDLSYTRFQHLLRRIDVSAEVGYSYFLENELSLNNMPILEMSNLTKSILQSIDYYEVGVRRRENYLYLEESLGTINKVKFHLLENQVPLVYPFFSANLNIRERLLFNKVFTPKYWPNVLDWAKEDSLEYGFVQNLIHLPVDQRYDTKGLKRILEIIKK